MIWIAVWFTLLVVNILDLAVNILHEDYGGGSMWDTGMVGIAAWLLLDAVKEEFFDA